MSGTGPAPRPPRRTVHRRRGPLTSATLAGAACPSAGWAAGSVRGTGADGVGLFRASSCFFSQ